MRLGFARALHGRLHGGRRNRAHQQLPPRSGQSFAGPHGVDQRHADEHRDAVSNKREGERLARRCGPSCRTSPSSATPSASAEKMSGITAMKMMRRKTWPKGAMTFLQQPIQLGIVAEEAHCTPARARCPTARPMKIFVCCEREDLGMEEKVK